VRYWGVRRREARNVACVEGVPGAAALGPAGGGAPTMGKHTHHSVFMEELVVDLRS